MALEQDTIAAIATAPGEAGISIVRVSGPSALAIADRLVLCSGPPPSQRASQSFVYGSIRLADAASDSPAIDEVIVLIYRGPNSYTREDVIEIQGHGGSTSARRVLRATLDAGARTAEPGEFTQRAFLSGRIDLMQAEAVIDLIRAGSDRAANAAAEQLSGSLSSSFNAIYDSLIDVAGDLEATLDFAEAELPSATMRDIIARVEQTRQKVGIILSTWEEGHLLREGALAVIAGQPNVGKSTLLNTLLGTERAIVTEVAGTTRDTIEEGLNLDGIPLRLVDTAGLRETDDRIEAEGIHRARAQMKSADLHLYLLDGSQTAGTVDTQAIQDLDPAKTLLILNKSDLGITISAQDFPGYTILHTSLATEDDLPAIRSAMLQKLGTNLDAPAHAVISERHRDLLNTAHTHLDAALSILKAENENGAAAASLDCRSALEELGTATGRIYHDELLSNVFSRFCVGK